MVRRHGAQSPASFQSTLGLFDAPMPFAEPPAFAGAAVDMPDPAVDFLQADIVSDANVGDVAPAMVPPAAPMGADRAPRDAVRRLERWRLMRPLAGGGGIPCSAGTPVECCVRTLRVELLPDASATLLWGAAVGRWGPGGVGWQGPLPACMTAIWSGFARLDAGWAAPESHPPGGEWRPSGQGSGGKRDAVIGAEAGGRPNS